MYYLDKYETMLYKHHCYITIHLGAKAPRNWPLYSLYSIEGYSYVSYIFRISRIFDDYGSVWRPTVWPAKLNLCIMASVTSCQIVQCLPEFCLLLYFVVSGLNHCFDFMPKKKQNRMCLNWLFWFVSVWRMQTTFHQFSLYLYWMDI